MTDPTLDPDLSARWNSAYRPHLPPAWDIGRPQPAFVRLADEGEITSPVLDSGCGTGEHAIFLAKRGMEVLGVDVASNAIEMAGEKASHAGVSVEFAVGSVLELDRYGRRFATAIDSGVFHTMSDEDRVRYAASLASVLEPGGVLHLLCFNEHTPGTMGPRRVTRAELRDAFADGWQVERIEEVHFEVRPEWWAERPRGWLARIVRTPGAPARRT